MNYERSENFTGEPKRAIEITQAVFIQSGYKILDVSDSDKALDTLIHNITMLTHG